jgi:nucleotide-binding universal stress UspA family protein
VLWSWDRRPVAPYAGLPGGRTADSERANAREGLDGVLRAGFGPSLPGEVDVELAEGPPERTLVDRSADAELLVLGGKARPERVGRVLGPVIRACLARAACPVVVVSAEEAPAVPQPARPRRTPVLAGRVPHGALAGGAPGR